MPFQPERMAVLRKKRKLSQKKLGGILNITQQQIASYESSDRVPSASTLERLADALKTTVDYLLNRTDNPEPLRESELTSDEREFLQLVRNDPAAALAILSERIRQTFRDNPGLIKNE